MLLVLPLARGLAASAPRQALAVARRVSAGRQARNAAGAGRARGAERAREGEFTVLAAYLPVFLYTQRVGVGFRPVRLHRGLLLHRV